MVAHPQPFLVSKRTFGRNRFSRRAGEGSLGSLHVWLEIFIFHLVNKEDLLPSLEAHTKGGAGQETIQFTGQVLIGTRVFQEVLL
jgi:hypothetical protein